MINEQKDQEWTNDELVSLGWIVHYSTTKQNIDLGTFIKEWEIVRLAIVRVAKASTLKEILEAVSGVTCPDNHKQGYGNNTKNGCDCINQALTVIKALESKEGVSLDV